ncbi:dienelactone hydrolase [Xylariomycetidae sp. FL0641]|nr:dienelactone hydrolase [Xylariomycetidae sp. FL0641]
MTSKPPSLCCAVGFAESGRPSGELETLNGVACYVARPHNSNSKGKGVLFLTDILGHNFHNSQVLADSYAANGYVCVVPDLFNGDAVHINPPDDFDFDSWLTHGTDGKGGHLPPQVDPIVEATIRAMREQLGVKRLAGAGYCFGAKSLIRFLKRGHIDVGFVAHPSFVDARELKAIHCPLSIAAAETDEIFPPSKRHETEDILMTHHDELPYQITLYSGTTHGFAVRGDTSQRQVAFAKTSAFVQAVQWFEEHLRD